MLTPLSVIILFINIIRLIYGLYILFKNLVQGITWLTIGIVEMGIISVYVGNDASIYIAFLMLIGVLIDIIILAYPLFHMPTNPDFMIILGSALNKNKMTKTLSNRLDKANEYYQLNKNIRVVVSGGTTKTNTISEARVMNDYLKKKGVNPSNILLEDKSTTTILNIENTISRYPSFKESKILVVSSSYHLLRASLILKKKGISNYELLIAHTPFPLLFNHLFFEKIYIFLLLINKLK